MIRFLLIVVLLFSACAPRSRASSEDKRQAMGLIDQGVLYLRNGNTVKAKAAFKVSYDLTPSPEALDGLGCAEMQSGEFDTAKKHFLNAVKLDSKYTTALGNLAYLYQLQGDEDSASEMYQRALQGDPDNFRVRNNLAGLLIDDYNRPGLSKNELIKASVVAEHPAVMRNLKQAGD